MIGYWVVVAPPRKTTTATRDGIMNRSPTFVPGELATLRISLLMKGREHFALGPIEKNGVPHGKRLYVYPHRYAKPDSKRLWEERPIGINRQVHNNDATSGMIASFKHLLKVNLQHRRSQVHERVHEGEPARARACARTHARTRVPNHFVGLFEIAHPAGIGGLVGLQPIARTVSIHERAPASAPRRPARHRVLVHRARRQGHRRQGAGRHGYVTVTNCNAKHFNYKLRVFARVLRTRD